MSRFRYVSLFSGIGGFEQALNNLGGNCVFASEFDKFAQQSYTALYGGEHLHGDITKIDENDVPDHDLLVGGFPCQSFSVAGKRKGFEDTRGTLFFDIARIAAEKKPKALLLENVKGLVNHDKGRTLDTMIETLNSIGYTVDFDVLNSKFFGVPQNRERIFIVAIRDDLVASEPFNEATTTGTTIVPRGKRRIGEWANTFNFDFPEQAEVTTRLRDVLETEVDEKYYLDGEKTAKLVAQLEKKDVDDVPSVIHNIYGGFKESKPRIFKGESPTIRTSAGGGHLPSIIEEDIGIAYIGDLRTQTTNAPKSFKEAYGVLDDKGICHTVQTMSGGNREPKIAEEFRPVLTPDRIEKRQNGRRFKEDGEESFTLTSQDKHGVAIGSPPKYRIRKLSPLECFRLQAFPDEAHQTLVDAGLSDSQRYKQAGNAVTVNVVQAIVGRLIPLINGQNKSAR